MENDWKLDVIELDYANDAIIQPLYASPEDMQGRGIELHVTDDGEPIDMTGKKVIFAWRNESSKKQGAQEFTASNAAKGIFNITYPTKMQTPGMAIARILIYEGESIQVSSRPFEIDVEKRIIDNSNLLSDNDFSMFLFGIDEMDGATQDAIDATEKANAATQAANTATQAANTATANANSATEAAKKATTEATSAASSATASAAEATSAANAANKAKSDVDTAMETFMTVTSVKYEYAVGDSNTQIPQSGWTEDIVAAGQGKWLWTKTTTSYNQGEDRVQYTFAYQGLDGNALQQAEIDALKQKDAELQTALDSVGKFLDLYDNSPIRHAEGDLNDPKYYNPGIWNVNTGLYPAYGLPKDSAYHDGFHHGSIVAFVTKNKTFRLFFSQYDFSIYVQLHETSWGKWHKIGSTECAEVNEAPAA